MNAESITASALALLARDGKLEAAKVKKAFGELGVNPEKVDPAVA